MADRHFQAQNEGGARVTSGVVSEGLAPNTWTIRCVNGASFSLPKAMFPHIKHDDQPTIMIGIVVTKLVEVDPIKGN